MKDLTITINLYKESDIHVQVTVGGLTGREVLKYIDAVKIALLSDDDFSTLDVNMGYYIETRVSKDAVWVNQEFKD